QNGLANDFRSGISENSLGCEIPTRDDALERFADDGIVCGCNDRRQIKLCKLGLLKFRDASLKFLNLFSEVCVCQIRHAGLARLSTNGLDAQAQKRGWLAELTYNSAFVLEFKYMQLTPEYLVQG